MKSATHGITTQSSVSRMAKAANRTHNGGMGGVFRRLQQAICERRTGVSVSVAAVFLLCSCATPNVNTVTKTAILNPDQEDNIGGSFIESGDIRTSADRMTASLLSLPQIAARPGGAGIAVSPIRNSTRHMIDKDLFMSRLRLELNRVSQGRIRFFSQGMGQEVRSEILSSQDEQQWDRILAECAEALAASPIVASATQPLRVAVLPIRNVNLAGVNADSFTALLRSAVSEKSRGKVQFMAREGSGRVISQVLAEADLRNLGLVAKNNPEQIAGVDYFLGGEFIAQSLSPGSAQPKLDGTTQGSTANVTKYLNVMLIKADSGAIPVEKMVKLERKVDSGLSRADFVLTGELRGLSKASAGGDRSDYVIMSFQLVDPLSNQIIWEDAYETKKVSNRSVIYK